MKEAIIKKDLRQLRKLTRSIEVAVEFERTHQKRIAILKSSSKNGEKASDAEKIEKVLKTINVAQSIKKATEIEEKYIAAINKLEPIDKIIIIDGYINGTAYWKIGQKIGYTEVGVQKRVNKIIERLSNLL